MRKFTMLGIMLAMLASPGISLAAECGAGGKGAVSILYGTGKTALTKAHKIRLKPFVDIAKHRSAICIFAQVDAQGTKAANEQVAAARAENVRRYMIAQGVPGNRILIAKQNESFTLFGLFESDQEGERKVTVSYSD